MLVSLLAVVGVLEVWLAIVCVLGFEQRSVVEWYADRKAKRRQRLYTLARPRRRVLV